ncbi:MAG TPA: polymer-forming cytoskeletal protein [Allosphingosinicella sp.]|jgi:cytoskeletal protein CcmA (bactofilin family)
MFGKTAKGDGAPRRAGTVSVIGADMTITGDVRTGEDLRVDGRIEGDVSCAGLELGEGGAIEGDVEADEVRLSGSVRGRISALSVTLEAAARVSGDVGYESLAVAAGARIEGRLGHRGGEGAAQAAAPKAKSAAAVAELFPAAAE